MVTIGGINVDSHFFQEAQVKVLSVDQLIEADKAGLSEVLQCDCFLLFTDNLSKQIIEAICSQVPSRTIAFVGFEVSECLRYYGHFDVTKLFEQSESVDQFLVKLRQIFAKGQNSGVLVPNEAAIIGPAVNSYQRNSCYDLKMAVMTGDFWQEALSWCRHPGNWMGGVTLFGFLHPQETYQFELFCEADVPVKVQVICMTKDEEITIFESKEKQFTLKMPDYTRIELKLLVKGQGNLAFQRILITRSRLGFGTFLPGDEWFDKKNAEELLCYEVPGKKKHHGIVSFTGALNHVPRFEYTTLTDYQYPTLYFSDFRARSGTFLLGKGLDLIFEAQVIQRIQAFMDKYQLNVDQLIFNGYSMGAYPALYYGAKLHVGTIIASKPFIRLGEVATDEATIWASDGTMIDAAYYLLGRMTQAKKVQLNQHFQKGFKEITGQTKVHLFQMLEDELAFDTIPMILTLLEAKNVSYELVSCSGKHSEKISEMKRFITRTIEAIAGGEA